MQQRRLGGQGLSTSAIGLGTMGMTVAYGPSDRDECIATIRKAFDLGVTFLDTAELYGRGEGERLLGEAVKDFRDEVTIATKFGFDFTGTRPSGLDSRPEHIREVVEKAFVDLGTDHIDVLYQHRVDPDVPIEDVAGVVGEYVEAGRVRYFGLSEAGEQTIRRAHAVHPVSVLQTEYSLFERDVETLFPTLRQLGIGFVAYSPLGRGLLTNAAQAGSEYSDGDFRGIDPRFQGENYERNAAAAGELRDITAEKGVTLAQLALAWVLAQGRDIVPIPGTRSPQRLADNLASADVTLTGADLARIREILPDGSYGDRYPSSMLPEWV